MIKGRILLKFQKMGNFLDSKVGDYNIIQQFVIVLDCLLNRFLKGVTMTDYFQYAFYEKNFRGRRKYATWGKLHKFARKCNDYEASLIFDDKSKFVSVFKDYIGRDVLDMRQASYEQFEEFTEDKDRIFVKPVDGSWGRGARIEEVCSINCYELFQKLHRENVLAESVIQQHMEMAEFNSSSTNTIRITTFVRRDGTSLVMPGAVIRIGRKGGVADNFHHGGIGAGIDIATGIVFTQAIDKAGNRYIFHPDSGKQIVGFKIPEWRNICETVKEAALLCPKVRYVGWDVAITNGNRIILVEGNDRADPDLAQMSSREGNWDMFRRLMDEL